MRGGGGGWGAETLGEAKGGGRAPSQAGRRAGLAVSRSFPSPRWTLLQGAWEEREPGSEAQLSCAAARPSRPTGFSGQLAGVSHDLPGDGRLCSGAERGAPRAVTACASCGDGSVGTGPRGRSPAEECRATGGLPPSSWPRQSQRASPCTLAPAPGPPSSVLCPHRQALLCTPGLQSQVKGPAASTML